MVAQRAALQIVGGPAVGRTFRLDRAQITVGRAPSNDIVLPQDRVSRLHAVIRSAGGTFYVQDQQSTNGTYLNDRRVEAATLQTGDRLRIGPNELLFTLAEAPVGIEPARAVPSRERAPARHPDGAPHGGYDGLGREFGNGMARAIAASRSYVGPAVLTWLVYWIGFWLPGLILNVVYLNSARKDERVSGQSPSGTGCLWVLLFTHGMLPAVVLIVVIVLLMVTGIQISQLFDQIQEELLRAG